MLETQVRSPTVPDALVLLSVQCTPACTPALPHRAPALPTRPPAPPARAPALWPNLQVALLKADWPPALLDHPDGAPVLVLSPHDPRDAEHATAALAALGLLPSSGRMSSTSRLRIAPPAAAPGVNKSSSGIPPGAAGAGGDGVAQRATGGRSSLRALFLGSNHGGRQSRDTLKASATGVGNAASAKRMSAPGAALSLGSSPAPRPASSLMASLPPGALVGSVAPPSCDSPALMSTASLALQVYESAGGEPPSAVGTAAAAPEAGQGTGLDGYPVELTTAPRVHPAASIGRTGSGAAAGAAPTGGGSARAVSGSGVVTMLPAAGVGAPPAVAAAMPSDNCDRGSRPAVDLVSESGPCSWRDMMAAAFPVLPTDSPEGCRLAMLVGASGRKGRAGGGGGSGPHGVGGGSRAATGSEEEEDAVADAAAAQRAATGLEELMMQGSALLMHAEGWEPGPHAPVGLQERVLV